jgi:hypothetical protein
MPLNAVRHARKMRGGAQAHLLQADDGQWYVVKFRNNPQHRRILVNELLASALLGYLQVSAPPTAMIHVSRDFLDCSPELHLVCGGKRLAVEPGWQFGSRYPGDPDLISVYDFLPDALLGKVANLEDFLGVLVFDKWCSNADGRQCVFQRVRVTGPGVQRQGFAVNMIDHGFAFNGPHWDFPDSPLQGLYMRRIVYEAVRSFDAFQPWMERVMNFPEEVIDNAWKRVPPEWVEGEEDELARLLERLFERRTRIPELIEACRKTRSNPFPNWQ